jgi:hypothetical protein
LPLRIAFDMDGVLADMDGELLKHAESLFGRQAVCVSRTPEAQTAPVDAAGPDTVGDAAESASPGPPDAAPPSTIRLTDRQHRRLWRHVSTMHNFWEALDEIEQGSVARLADVAASRHWEVIFVTKRPATAGATAQRQTQRWLQAKGFELPSVFVVQGSRGRIASSLALDVVVDDRAENCVDVAVESRARAVLVCRHEHHGVDAARRLGVRIVSTFSECLDVIIEMDADAAEPGVVARLRRMLRR